MSKKRSQSTPKKELGVMGLLLAMLIMGALGWFSKDATGYPYRAYGAMWWATAVFMAFMIGLLYYALFVLPIPGSEGWTEGLRLLARNYMEPPPKTESAPKGRRSKTKTAVIPQHLTDLPPSFRLLGSGLVRSNQALALTKGGGFSRAAGPGFVILFKNEQIAQTIDVRNHTRSEIVKANTRDGIPIELPIFIGFRVWRNQTEITQAKPPYQYDPDAIFYATYAGSVLDAESASRWSDLVTPIATNLFVTEIARHTLDQLYQVDSDGNGAKSDINKRVQRSLERNDRLDGIELLSVGSGIPSLPEAVRQQRLKKWQAQWQREIIIKKARGDSEAELRLKHARARAQIEIIQNITRSIATSNRNGISVTEIVALRMIEALEDAVSDVSVQALVPQPVLTTMIESSRQMLDWVEDEEEDAYDVNE